MRVNWEVVVDEDGLTTITASRASRVKRQTVAQKGERSHIKLYERWAISRLLSYVFVVVEVGAYRYGTLN